MSEQWQPGPGRRVCAATEPTIWERIVQKYGKPYSELRAPDGYEFVMRANGEPEFRPAKNGEKWRSRYGVRAVTATENYSPDYCVLILRKLPEPPKPRRWEERERCPGTVCVTFHAEGRSAWLYEVTK